MRPVAEDPRHHSLTASPQLPACLPACACPGYSPQYNVFGRTFKAVLEHPDSTTQWDDSREAFDTAVVYVNKASVTNFLIDIREALCEAAKAAEKARQQEQQQAQQQEQGQQQGRRRSRQAGEDGQDSRDSQRARVSEQEGAAAAAEEEKAAGEASDQGAREELAASDMQEDVGVVAASEDGEDEAVDQ